jgi:ATP-grasp domain
MPTADTLKQGRQGKPTKVLLVTGNWVPIPARLAMALIEHGCAVSAACPPGHPLRYVYGISNIHAYSCLTSQRSVAAAVCREQPDIVVPCDDRSAFQLHELHRLRPELRTLIERSLGDPRAFSVLQRRSRLLEMARELGIRVADFCSVTSAAHAAECFPRFGPTALLKIDGTAGGQGVQIVRSPEAAAAAFRRMRSAAGFATALKRLTVNRDPQVLWSWSRREKLTTTMQQFVHGTPANIMAACWNGRIVGEVSVEAISSQGVTGAALVVRLIDNEELSRAAALLAGRLGLSGFFGLDFMLERGTGAAHLIEMNPRCTQLGHLKVPSGDLAGALCASLTERERPKPPSPIATDKIAFFPQAWQWGATSAFLGRLYHDVPWEQRRLVEALMREPWPERRWIARLYHLFRPPAPLQAVEVAADLPTR